MGGMRKHVHHAGGDQPETVPVDQDAGVACQRGGMAGNIDDASGRLVRQVLQHLVGAGARGIEQQLVPGLPRPLGGALVLEQVGHVEARVGDAVVRGILRSAFDQAVLA